MKSERGMEIGKELSLPDFRNYDVCIYPSPELAQSRVSVPGYGRVAGMALWELDGDEEVFAGMANHQRLLLPFRLSALCSLPLYRVMVR